MSQTSTECRPPPPGADVSCMEINPRLLAIARAGDQENTRYALGCVRVERAAGLDRLVASDGRMLIIAEQPTPTSEQGSPPAFEGLLPIDLAQWLRELPGTLWLRVDDGTVVAMWRESQPDIITAHFPSTKSRFPNYTEALKSGDGERIHLHVNPNVLRRLLNTICRMQSPNVYDARLVLSIPTSCQRRLHAAAQGKGRRMSQNDHPTPQAARGVRRHNRQVAFKVWKALCEEHGDADVLTNMRIMIHTLGLEDAWAAWREAAKNSVKIPKEAVGYMRLACEYIAYEEGANGC